MGKTVGSTVQNLSGPIAELAIAYAALSGAWGLAIIAGAGLLATFRELAEDRGRELFDFVRDHQDEFVDEIVGSPEFIATFVNVWEKHIRETAEQKRIRLRNFLLSLGSGGHVPQDTHTKIYSVIEQMTDQEATIFGIIFLNSNSKHFRQMHLNTTSISGLEMYSEAELKDALHSLHTYRLIDAIDATIGATMAIQQITSFGELYYHFVLCRSGQNQQR